MAKDLKIKPSTLNLREDKVGNDLELTGTGVDFLNKTLIAQALRSTTDRWDLMKLKTFCMAKGIIIQKKQQPTKREKIFTNYTSDARLISKIYKELKKLNIKNPNNQIKNEYTNREFSIKKTKTTEKHLKKYSTSLPTRKMKIKSTLKLQLKQIRTVKVNNSNNSSC